MKAFLKTVSAVAIVGAVLFLWFAVAMGYVGF